MRDPDRRRLLPLALLLLVGCTSTVRPPLGPLEDPVTVFLVREARHSGLVLPQEGFGYVEYGYGEWEWYAMEADSWYRVFPAVLWPTRGTLGRRTSAAEDELELRERWWWLELESFRVERARADALRDRLDAAFESRLDELHHSKAYGIDFVPSDDGYWCLFNCHDSMTDWLREIGCEVGRVPIRGGLSLERRAES